MSSDMKLVVFDTFVANRGWKVTRSSSKAGNLATLGNWDLAKLVVKNLIGLFKC